MNDPHLLEAHDRAARHAGSAHRSGAEPSTERRIPVSLVSDGGARVLRIVVGHRVTLHRLPDAGVLLLGRSTACDVMVPDEGVSRRHARLRVSAGARVEIEDLGSANGTRVGDRRVGAGEPVLLAPGEVVRLGGALVFLEQAATRTRVDPVSRGSSPLAGAGATGALAALRPLVERFAAGTIPVLVTGETGVGKDVLSGMLHALSPRARRPLVCINCAALPEALLESELFGHERGAFTGATQAKTGILESAAGGTVFLDEVGEMPLGVQAKLLRVLDQREVLRLGATRPTPIDVRFIAATNKDLDVQITRGLFRQDLYYRLNGASVVIPPLRERRDEILDLARRFAADAAMELGLARAPRLGAAVMARLERHPWPGNVRELKNLIARAVLLAEGDVIDLEHLPDERCAAGARAVPLDSDESAVTQRTGAVPAGDEHALILRALEQCDGNQTRAAGVLGVSRRTLVSRLSAYGLTRKRPRPRESD
jgi:two-component system response regulator AtoC